MSQAKRQPSLDIIITRTWEVDLRRAGIVSERKNRPVKRNRQPIVRFLGREGTVERFAIRQTMPPSTIEPSVYPTQAQYGAVTDFFVEGCETRWQANTLLCARDYSEIVARHFSFPRERRQFLWVCIAAFILGDGDLRSQVRAWIIASRSRAFGDIESGIAHQKPFKRSEAFALKLIDDMRAAGSEMFG